MATQYANGKIVTSGLVLALDAADRNSYVSGSTIWNDVSGNENNGTLTNGPTFSNNSIVFDGTNDYVGSFGNYNTYFNFNSNSTFTISCFFKATINNNYKALVVSSNSTGNWNYGIWISNGASNYLLVGYDGANRLANTSLTTNTIYQACLVYTSNTQTIYLNGVVDGIFTSVPIFNATNQQLSIGRRGDRDDSYLTGNIYNVQIYNRDLSAQEVLQNYNAQKSRFNL
jgi:hypothetical protein